MARELSVYLDGTHAGTLHQSAQGNTTFQYDDAYRLERRGPTPLSLSMPLTRREHPNRVVLPFLQGLLPDSPTKLDQLAAEHHTSARNAFGLLAHVGRDAAGAVQVLPPGEDSPDAATRQGDVTPLTDAEVGEVIADLIEHRDTWGQQRAEMHWSLPGAQPKVALFRFEDGTWGTPRDSTPTTHILKPAVPPYTDHDVNEHVTMAAAQILGLAVSRHELMTTDRGDRVFVSTRYDRRKLRGRWARLHQEDLCQALSVAPARKYQQDGGPGVNQVAALFDNLADPRDAADSRRRFFDALVFNVSAACTDAHAKNFSMLLSGRRATLAPLYDVGTHATYSSREPLRSAMMLDDEYTLDAIGLPELLKAATRLRIPADLAAERVAYIRSNLAAAFADAAGRTTGSPEVAGYAATVANSIHELVVTRGWA
ncbi:serine/threonine-protein kinase HipA [Cryobacterium psychrotolerans]|uniref:Serine/threonine-protein kinase HipA n=2 Tax=Cryobacterium TaxID=69578 RepID=A0A1G9BX81_9MICO|nr:HipA domain-containing protein [Cryobacterium psychrotolerans]TFD84119.1 type II toxin-antitoxin system HipA family toxin [Cryobacterium psychrotolerans]SDK44056.1 serine/threonine-protein kinase HipA [Cryobacterium psychrotolerans]